MEEASIAHLLKDRPERSSLLQDIPPSIRELPVNQRATAENFSSPWSPRTEPTNADRHAASLASDLFFKAIQEKDKGNLDDALGLFNILELNHLSEAIPLSRGYLQIESQRIKFKLGHNGAIEGLEDIIRQHSDPDYPCKNERSTSTTGPLGKSEYCKDIQVAARFEISRIYDRRLEKSGDLSEDTIARATVEALSTIERLIEDEHKEGSRYSFIRRLLHRYVAHLTVVRTSPSRVETTYQDMVHHLNSLGFSIQPVLRSTSSKPTSSCPRINSIPKNIVNLEARAADLIILNNLIAGKNKRCGIEMGQDLKSEKIMALGRAAGNGVLEAGDAVVLAIYQNIIEANIGMWSYHQADRGHLLRSRNHLLAPHGFFQKLLPEPNRNSAIQAYLNRIRAYLASINAELGNYGTANVLAREILRTAPNHSSALMLLVKTELRRGSFEEEIDTALNTLDQLELPLEAEHRIAYLRAKKLYLEGYSASALDLIESSGALPTENRDADRITRRRIDTHIVRLYAELLIDQGYHLEAERTLDVLSNNPRDTHNSNESVEEALTALAWANLYIAQGRLAAARDILSGWENERIQANELSGFHAQLPEILATMARIEMLQGNSSSAILLHKKARGSLFDVELRDRRASQRLSMTKGSRRLLGGFWYTSAELSVDLLEQELKLREASKEVAPDRCLEIAKVSQNRADHLFETPRWRDKYLLLVARASLCNESFKSAQTAVQEICDRDASIAWDLRQQAAVLTDQVGLLPSTCAPSSISI